MNVIGNRFLFSNNTVNVIVQSVKLFSKSSTVCNINISNELLKQSHKILYQPVRYRGATGIFSRQSADHLWKSVIAVSNAGRKRGRGRTRHRGKIKDLNKGQIIGIGKANIRWPGLSAPIIKGRELIKQEQLPPDPSYQDNLIKLRDQMGRPRRMRLAPIERGFSGNRLPGRKIGPPDPIGEDTFEGFETICLELKPVAHMTKAFGRYRTVSATCVTGNGNGLVGYAKGKALEGKSAVKAAKNRAAQRLMYIERYNDHTVCHNFYSRFYNTKVYAWKKPEGYGLKCHRVIKAICEVAGIRNLAAKVERSTNPDCVAKAFLLGLLRQKTLQELANEVQLHVVEFSAEHGNFPKVVASPPAVKTDVTEPPDFDQYIMDGKIFHRRKKPMPGYTKYVGYPIMVRKWENIRNHKEQKQALRAEYGELRSFLTEKYSECKPFLPPWSRVFKDGEKSQEDETAETK